MDAKAAQKVLKEHGFKPGDSTAGHPARADIKAALRVVRGAPKPKPKKEA